MQIKYWKNFSKRRNSTKRPTGGTQLDVVLQEPCVIEAPHFILGFIDTEINYLTAFGHYYYVTEITILDRNRMELSCAEDCLATYKSSIQSFTGFIERSATSYNVDISDPYVTIEQGETVQTDGAGTMDMFNETGIYILTVINDIGCSKGFTCYYLMDSSTVEKIASYVNQQWGSGESTILGWLQATFMRTAQSIVKCTWLPVSLTLATQVISSSEQVVIGTDSVAYGGSPVMAYRITAGSVASWGSSGDKYVSIPAVYTDFRKSAPYTECRLYLPFIGQVTVNPIDFNNDKIYIAYDVDMASGDSFVRLKDGNGKLISTFTTNIGVDCPIGHTTTNIQGALSSTGNTITQTVGAIAAKTGAGTVVASVGAVVSAANALVNTLTTSSGGGGNTGGRATAKSGLEPICTIIAKNTIDPDNIKPEHGRPLMEVGSLSALSGFVKCADANVPMAGTSVEKAEVNAYLNAGLFIE